MHGEVTAAEPKVFQKYFFINVKTGEKSCEIGGNPYIERARKSSADISIER